MRTSRAAWRKTICAASVLGVALDGTGFGTDGKIWGGEFLVADFAGFTRRAHLRNVLLPGGDAAVRQPWRMALSYLRDAFGQQIPSHLKCFQGIDEKQVALVDTMLARRIQTVETSSCGRLFDAVAALLGLASEVTFEGQAAIALEAAAERGIERRYDFEIEEGEPIDPRLPASHCRDRERYFFRAGAWARFPRVFTTP